MPRGFFAGSEVVSKEPPSNVPKCGACGLYKKCHTPKMPVAGEGRKGILLIGEAPSQTDDEEGKPFAGKSGERLRKSLKTYGVDMDRDCWSTNALICRPKGNRTPTPEEIDYCRPNLLKVIRELNPRVIMLFGLPAMRSVLGHLWKDDVGAVASRWVGWDIPCQEFNAWIYPMNHPSYILRCENDNNMMPGRFFFEPLVELACDVEGRPWEVVPDYQSEVKRVTDQQDAARFVQWVLDNPAPIAFDYETNMLKPDSDKAVIVSCSICYKGKRTFAFPWQGEVIDLMGKVLKHKMPKIASNLKFEDRWTRKEFGYGVNGWAWDTMQAAHVDSNRPGITSIKFQSFVRLGFGAYDDHIEQFLRSRGSMTVNRILQEIELDDLLMYNGLDSLLEFRVACKQKELMDYA